MKKSLISLAVLAASGASFAQSSVAVYGIVDAAFVSNKHDVWDPKTEMTVSETQTKLDSGAVDTSRYGFKGTEDLGGGLSANFKLEQGINVDKGTAETAGSAFNRHAYVGFSSASFGEIRLGLTSTAYEDINTVADAAFDSNVFGPQNIVFVSSGGGILNDINDYFRTDTAALNKALAPVLPTGVTWSKLTELLTYNPLLANTIYYATPTSSGFSGALSFSFGEDKAKAGGTGSASSTTSFHLKYEAGPVFVGFAYQTQDLQYAPPLDVTTNFTRLNATYDLGVAKLLAAYGRVAVKDEAVTELTIGADYPVTNTFTLSGGFARSNSDQSSLDFTNKVYSLAGSYALSKRTSVYGGYESHTLSSSSWSDISGSKLGAGVKHTF